MKLIFISLCGRDQNREIFWSVWPWALDWQLRAWAINEDSPTWASYLVWNIWLPMKGVVSHLVCSSVVSRLSNFTSILCLPCVYLSPQILDVRNVMVVVSRWYGGILLGPDRFKHINNCARNILVEEGYTASMVRHSLGFLRITLSSSTDTSSVKFDIAVSLLMLGNAWYLVV